MNVVGARLLLIVIVNLIEEAKETLRLGELESTPCNRSVGELMSTPRNTYANAGSVAQFDFHQSEKSKVSVPLLSFLSSNGLMEPGRVSYFMTSAFSEQQVNQLLNPKLNK
jgi:hypothetical protein